MISALHDAVRAHEHVAHAAHGADAARIARVVFQLLPEMADVDVERSVDARIVYPVRGFDKERRRE